MEQALSHGFKPFVENGDIVGSFPSLSARRHEVSQIGKWCPGLLQVGYLLKLHCKGCGTNMLRKYVTGMASLVAVGLIKENRS